MDITVSRLLEFKRENNITNEAIATICGVTKQAVTEVFQGRTKSVPLRWLTQLIAAYELDANYFFRKEATKQLYTSEKQLEMQSIPLLGKIAAGFNKHSEEIHEGGFLVPMYLLPKKRPCFALQVSGDSMIGAGIIDGDICVIEKQDNPSAIKHGDIAAFRVDGDATLKYFHKKDKQAWLVPANPNYQPIPVNASREVELIGLFVSLLRPPI